MANSTKLEVQSPGAWACGDSLPTETERTAAYNAELINRYRTAQFLSETDKREARRLIASKAAQA